MDNINKQANVLPIGLVFLSSFILFKKIIRYIKYYIKKYQLNIFKFIGYVLYLYQSNWINNKRNPKIGEKNKTDIETL